MIYLFCIYIGAAFGLAYVIGHAKISRSLREWAYDVGFGQRLVEVETTEVIKAGSTTFEPRWYPLRWIVELVECPACCGFHIGFWLWFTAAMNYYLSPSTSAALGLVMGCFTAASNFVLGRATGLIPRQGG